MDERIGIYSIVSPSGKRYVGMTMTGFTWRWKGHLKDLRGGRHKNAALSRAFAKYGEANLHFTVLEVVPSTMDQSIVLLKEQQWWDKLHSSGVKLYNGRPTGTGSVIHTEETKKKMSKTFSEKNKDLLKRRERNCEFCSKTFSHPNKTVRFCCGRCSSLAKGKSFAYSRDELIDLYITQDKTVSEIMQILGCKQRTVYYLLKEHAIPLKRGRKT